jgi:Mg2+ and Co2+ transporter CorA
MRNCKTESNKQLNDIQENTAKMFSMLTKINNILQSIVSDTHIQGEHVNKQDNVDQQENRMRQNMRILSIPEDEEKETFLSKGSS